ncbi:group-specific protein [Cytobacillus suaedae]|nr:group-specific protein [Cytobacillus suaedae]
MSTCNIDHSLEDVLKKLESQKAFLPQSLYETTETYLSTTRTQETLNEIFHLLKKYDLATDIEQSERNEKLSTLLNL